MTNSNNVKLETWIFAGGHGYPVYLVEAEGRERSRANLCTAEQTCAQAARGGMRRHESKKMCVSDSTTCLECARQRGARASTTHTQHKATLHGAAVMCSIYRVNLC